MSRNPEGTLVLPIATSALPLCSPALRGPFARLRARPLATPLGRADTRPPHPGHIRGTCPRRPARMHEVHAPGGYCWRSR